MQNRKVGAEKQARSARRYHEEAHLKENLEPVRRGRSRGMKPKDNQEMLKKAYCCFKKTAQKKTVLFHISHSVPQGIVRAEQEEARVDEQEREEARVDEQEMEEARVDEQNKEEQDRYEARVDEQERYLPQLSQEGQRQAQKAVEQSHFPKVTSMEDQMQLVYPEVNKSCTDCRERMTSIKLRELDGLEEKEQQPQRVGSMGTKRSLFKMPSMSCEFQTVQSFGNSDFYCDTSMHFQTEVIPRRKRRPVLYKGLNCKIYLDPKQQNAQTRSVTKEILQAKETYELTHTLRSIMQSLQTHPNIVYMHSAETIFRKQSSAYYLQYSMDYYEKNIDYAISNAASLSPLLKKLISFQILKGVSYLHLNNIQHGYLDPTNILISRRLRVGLSDLKLARMGAVCLKCHSSWYYRAPEVVLGSQSSAASEMWSVGVIIAELQSSNKLFVESCDAEFLIEIMKLLGKPTQAEIEQMHPNYDKEVFYFPKVHRTSLSKVSTDPTLIDLLKHLLRYTQRWSATECLAHPYFAQLKDNTIFTQLLEKYEVGSLFQFNEVERKQIEQRGLDVVPAWYTDFYA